MDAWQIEYGHEQRDGRPRYWQITDGSDAICCNQFCAAGTDDKAHLLAAAPELLSALKLALAYLDCSLGSPAWQGENPYPVIDAAIALAEGRATPATAEPASATTPTLTDHAEADFRERWANRHAEA